MGDALLTEMESGKCVVFLAEGGEVVRAVVLVVLEVTDHFDRIFVQIGSKTSNGEVAPCCKLPACKLAENEQPLQAVERIKSTELLDEAYGGFDITCTEKMVETKYSKLLGITTRYHKIVQGIGDSIRKSEPRTFQAKLCDPRFGMVGASNYKSHIPGIRDPANTFDFQIQQSGSPFGAA